MGHREKRIGNLLARVYWHRDVIGLGVEVKWVRNHYVEVWVLLPMLSFGLAYSLLRGRSWDSECWVDE